MGPALAGGIVAMEVVHDLAKVIAVGDEDDRAGPIGLRCGATFASSGHRLRP